MGEEVCGRSPPGNASSQQRRTHLVPAPTARQSRQGLIRPVCCNDLKSWIGLAAKLIDGAFMGDYLFHILGRSVPDGGLVSIWKDVPGIKPAWAGPAHK